MSDRWDDDIITRYDLRSWREGCRPYLECGPGWAALIESLVSDLIAMGWDREVHQVKEKFSRLRFYIGEATPEMITRLCQAEADSSYICEQCGAPGETDAYNGYWLKTLCPEHAAQVKRRD